MDMDNISEVEFRELMRQEAPDWDGKCISCGHDFASCRGNCTCLSCNAERQAMERDKMPKMLVLVRRLIKPDGSVEPYPPKGKTYTLKEMQEAVGGYIEILHPPDPRLLMVINEEGKLKSLPNNDAATRLMGENLLQGDYIVGNALVCWNKDID